VRACVRVRVHVLGRTGLGLISSASITHSNVKLLLNLRLNHKGMLLPNLLFVCNMVHGTR